MKQDVYEAARGLLRALKATLYNCRHCMECGNPAIEAEADRAIAEAERAGIVAPPDEGSLRTNATQVAVVPETGGLTVPGLAAVVTIQKPGPFRVVRLVVNVNNEHTVHLESERDSGYVTWFGQPSCWGELVRAYDTGETITAERLHAIAFP